MQRRLVLLLAPVLVLLVVGVAGAYGIAVAERATQEVQLDRSADAARFASMTERAVASGSTARLAAELDAYTTLYSSPVWVVGLDGTLIHGPGSPLPDAPGTTTAVESALAGARPAAASPVWPWETRVLHVVEPVGAGAQAVAAVVIEVPTDHLRAQILRRWATGAAAMLVVTGLLIAGVWPMTRWMLRPVRELESVAQRVRTGDLDARADADHGPPELRGLATSFNAMVTQVQRSSRRQQAFVEDAAHQLRNPLASLRLAVENLAPVAVTGDSRDAHLEAVDEAVRMGRTLDSMLAATALATGRGDREPVAEALHAGAPGWRSVLAEAGMALEVEDGGVAEVVRAPAGGLSTLLDELVSNAARLSGGTRVRVSAERLGPDRVRLVVADDGTGLSEHERDAALGRFWRAARHQNVVGTGLGLAILADVVGAAGGRIALEAARPHGLRVLVDLPVEPELRA